MTKSGGPLRQRKPNGSVKASTGILSVPNRDALHHDRGAKPKMGVRGDNVGKPMLSSKQVLEKELAFTTTLSLCQAVLEELNTPRALSISMLLEHGEWDALAQGLPIRAEDYLDPESFFRDYQATHLLAKADFLPTSFDRKAKALERFESAEVQCSETNARLRSVYFGGSSLPDPEIDGVISDARSIILSILGRFPAERLLDNCRWGPGATTSIRNPGTSVYQKYLEPVTGSGPCLTLFGPLVDQVTLWSSFQRGFFIVSDGNKVVFVPKNAKTDRSIAMEPSFDSFIQLGIGQLVRSRLLLNGVNLKSQEQNRDLARYGSLTGSVATIDLSMASDTISKLVPELLLPADWLVAMKACRSTHWRMGESISQYHKFSSMGNGYTFEMETLIFFALARAVAKRLSLPDWEVTAYGDDLTIGVEGVDLLSRTMSFLGFTVNLDKSFSSGPFRESCGKDFFLGTNVRPYYVRTLLRDVRDFMKFHNGILRGLIPLKKSAAKALRLIEPLDRIFGPRSLGDTVFFSSAPQGKFALASKRFPMFEGYIVRHWCFKPEKVAVSFLEPAILASLYSNKEAPTLGFATLRKRGIWETRAVIIPSWDDSGP